MAKILKISNKSNTSSDQPRKPNPKEKQPPRIQTLLAMDGRRIRYDQIWKGRSKQNDSSGVLMFKIQWCARFSSSLALQ